MSVDRALAELRRPFDRWAFFYDDNFAADRTRTHALLDGLLRRDRRFTFSVQVRADVARDEDLVAKLARAGCVRVYVGIESVNDGSLKEMHKQQTAEDVRQAVRRFHRHGISVHGMFMFGTDSDSPAEVRAAESFVQGERLDSVQYMVGTPFPGTELFRKMEAEDRLLHKVWRYYDGMHVVIRPRGFSPEQLQRLAIGCYGRFYNLRQACRTGWETAVASLGRVVGVVPERLGAASVENALLKVVGARIVRQWLSYNSDYLRYLASLGAPAG
jgi:radical SAM superfamily enzyme YgiQ (UPF0313 family)